MRSRTSCFNSVVFSHSIRRFWPFWAAYFIVGLLLLPTELVSFLSRELLSPIEVKTAILRSAEGSSAAMAVIFAPFAAMSVFGWLYQNRSAGFMTALPLRREGLFLSCFAAGLVMLWAGPLLSALCSWAVLCIGGWGSAGLGTWLLVSLLDILNFYGFAVLCAMLTGSTLILPLVYGLLQIAPLLVESVLNSLIPRLLYGLEPGGSALQALSPISLRLSGVFADSRQSYDPALDRWITTECSLEGLPVVFIGAGIGLLLAALAFWLFRRRAMESAGSPVAVPVLKPVFRYCLAIGVGLCFAALLDSLIYQGSYVPGTWSHVLFVLLLLLLGSGIGWLAADMLIYKRFAVFSLHWKSGLVLWGILSLLLLGARADVTGAMARIPEPEDYESVWINTYGSSATLEGEEGKAALRALHESILSHRSLHENKLVRQHSRVCIDYMGPITEDGQKLLLRRVYYLAATPDQAEDPDSDWRQLEALLNLPEAILSRKPENPESLAPDIVLGYGEQNRSCYSPETGELIPTEGLPLRLSEEEARELYTQCILPDLRDGTLGRIWLIEDEAYAREVLNLSIHIEYRQEDNAVSNNYTAANDYFFTYPTVNSRRTNAWLREHGVDTESLWDYLLRCGAEEELAYYSGMQETAEALW